MAAFVRYYILFFQDMIYWYICVVSYLNLMSIINIHILWPMTYSLAMCVWSLKSFSRYLKIFSYMTYNWNNVISFYFELWIFCVLSLLSFLYLASFLSDSTWFFFFHLILACIMLELWWCLSLLSCEMRWNYVYNGKAVMR